MNTQTGHAARQSRPVYQPAEQRCRCMTTVYGGVKRCQGHVVPGSPRGWCRRHEFYNGANHTPVWQHSSVSYAVRRG